MNKNLFDMFNDLDNQCKQFFDGLIPQDENFRKELKKLCVNDDNSLTDFGEQLVTYLSSCVLKKVLGDFNNEN